MLGYHPQVILAGRRINDGMGKYIAEQTVKQLIAGGRCRSRARTSTCSGLTFKENCPDLRNSRVIDVIRELAVVRRRRARARPGGRSATRRAHEYGIELTAWDDAAARATRSSPRSRIARFARGSLDEVCGQAGGRRPVRRRQVRRRRRGAARARASRCGGCDDGRAHAAGARAFAAVQARAACAAAALAGHRQRGLHRIASARSAAAARPGRGGPRQFRDRLSPQSRRGAARRRPRAHGARHALHRGRHRRPRRMPARVRRASTSCCTRRRSGSVPRSIEDPLRYARRQCDRFPQHAGGRARCEACSASSTPRRARRTATIPGLPKVEDAIGRPLSPYAVTKLVDELYADVFAPLLRPGDHRPALFQRVRPAPGSERRLRRGDPALGRRDAARRAGRHQRRRRDHARFLLRRQRRAGEPARRERRRAARRSDQVYNVAVGGRTSLNELRAHAARARWPSAIRASCVGRRCTADSARATCAHSQADIGKAQRLLGYAPAHDVRAGLREALPWYEAAARCRHAAAGVRGCCREASCGACCADGVVAAGWRAGRDGSWRRRRPTPSPPERPWRRRSPTSTARACPRTRCKAADALLRGGARRRRGGAVQPGLDVRQRPRRPARRKRALRRCSRSAAARGHAQAQHVLTYFASVPIGALPECMRRADGVAACPRRRSRSLRTVASPIRSRACRRGSSGSRASSTSLRRRYAIDPRLALAVIAVESNFEPDARSDKGRARA